MRNFDANINKHYGTHFEKMARNCHSSSNGSKGEHDGFIFLWGYVECNFHETKFFQLICVIRLRSWIYCILRHNTTVLLQNATNPRDFFQMQKIKVIWGKMKQVYLFGNKMKQIYVLQDEKKKTFKVFRSKIQPIYVLINLNKYKFKFGNQTGRCKWAWKPKW